MGLMLPGGGDIMFYQFPRNGAVTGKTVLTKNYGSLTLAANGRIYASSKTLYKFALTPKFLPDLLPALVALKVVKRGEYDKFVQRIKEEERLEDLRYERTEIQKKIDKFGLKLTARQISSMAKACKLEQSSKRKRGMTAELGPGCDATTGMQ